MRIIFHSSTDPYFNLAAEEYLLDHSGDDVFMVWRNERSVIIGKNQNTWAQVDLEYARASGIGVVRRLSGGGAVFHDLGNVNFTFITAGDTIDFAAFTAPILRALASFGVEASLGGRNDIVTAQGAKISGCAACVHQTSHGTRRLHHGTLLYGADLSALARVLTPDPEKLSTKGIDSVRSRVANIQELSGRLKNVSAEAFAGLIADFASGEFGEAVSDLTETEKRGIAHLADEKYRTWEWNFGSSPEFEVTRSCRFPYGKVTAELNAEHGVIGDIRITGDFFSSQDVELLCERLRGVRLEQRELLGQLDDVALFVKGSCPEDICTLICG